MRYYLDFDRTLFRTDDFYHFQKTHPFFCEHVALLQSLIDNTSTNRQAVNNTLYNTMQKNGFSFRKGEIAEYVYPDVVPFLNRYKDTVCIITFGHPDYQKMKIDASGLSSYVSELLLVDDVLKGAYFSSREPKESEFVFVDDSVEQLADVAAHFPNAHVYEIRRDGKAGDGRFPVIHSLAELDGLS